MTSAYVIVSSTRAAAGTYQDRTGPVLVDWLRSRGLDTPDAEVVADAEIAAAVTAALGSPVPPRVLLTTGGTGLNPDDRTVEAVREHLDTELPGIVQAFFAQGLASTPMAVLSRAVAGTTGRTFVMTLPGSRGAVADGIAVLDPLLDHLISQLEGRHDH
ncbi:molybdopterin-binding protein [Corynebacterium uberis]|uniref:molybdopterin-binding protein n=1 Tax=Corynebacterium TaxID=1716 RepID=UPI001D0B330B|nr:MULTISPECIES: molybdopterin-binding protein [Corynebacterium]MCZ9309017.1 molybdopterin-binding protein [Corynebacterium sp. c6VSa_13]UDL74516.1 MogA/MoaB family molybdenum cofactor biosynthesis protein [Corynebacterium uberis]UDL76649.1 MogA/MoaB family molybdenum cofactor biosynthesis protein [Corynebacterium uberis]UDL78862.1 MogA/MoaB family molybdenum cofactor biosynthesis protein [Corynebacterium uberis]UDL81140.1 MogA/MoaB family molybdenum cofactor biosynthesis protein [Corynebacter